MPRPMQQIDHVIHLMLENRSLDNVLGWLYEKESPLNFYPSTNRNPYAGLFDGLTNPFHYDGVTKDHPVTRVVNPADFSYAVPDVDPDESFEGVRNQIFGDTKAVNHEPPVGTVPRMKGFLQDYYGEGFEVGDLTSALRIMQCFGPEQLPTLNGIARQFAVSDAWFSSVPTQTNPNRAFSICGTSLGRRNNLHDDAHEEFNTPTIFNGLSSVGASWGIYWQYQWYYVGYGPYTQYTFPQLQNVGQADHEIGHMTDLYKRIIRNDLPAFTYIEPYWGFGITYNTSTQGNDYHPPTSVNDGEVFLYSLLTLLMLSPAWDKTLLIITFDEHGGTYDHISPGWNATPDGLGPTNEFAFNRFGVRVPTILVSPYIKERTVFRSDTKVPFDHTSVIKTVLAWQGYDLNLLGGLFGARMKAAPMFDKVLSDTRVNLPWNSPDRKPFLERIKPIADRVTDLSQPQTFKGPLNETMRGVSAGAVRYILAKAKSDREQIERLAEEYRRDPEAFEVGRIGVRPLK